MDSKVQIGELEALYRERYVAFVRVASAIAGDPARGLYITIQSESLSLVIEAARSLARMR